MTLPSLTRLKELCAKERWNNSDLNEYRAIAYPATVAALIASVEELSAALEDTVAYLDHGDYDENQELGQVLHVRGILAAHRKRFAGEIL